MKLTEILFRHYPTRSILVAALMITQSFLYNAIFFTSGLVLEYYFHVNPTNTGYYFFAFAAGNLAGPLLLGRLFDTVGRKPMIAGTYILAGVLLVAYMADVLAPSFGGQKNFTQAVKAVAYAYTAAWVGGVGFVVPGLRWLILLAGGIYSIYLLHLGLPYTMKCPPEKAWRYTAVTILAAVIVRWLVGIVAVDIGGVGYAGYGPRAVSSSGIFEPASPGGKLERWPQSAWRHPTDAGECAGGGAQRTPYRSIAEDERRLAALP